MDVDSYGRTELTLAIIHHQMEKALKLFDEYGDVKFKDSVGVTDLYYAAREGHLELIRKMLEKGADPNLENLNGGTPLWGVIESVGHAPVEQIIGIAKLLLEAGADPNKTNFIGQTLKEMSTYIAKGPISDYICNDSKETKEQ